MQQKNLLWVVTGAVVLLVIGAVAWNSMKLTPGADNKEAVATSTATEEGGVRAEQAYTSTRVKEGDRFVTIVNYMGDKFSPRIVMVNRGEEVRFVNKTDQSMRIVSDTFQNIPLYPEFNQEKTVGKGGTYSIIFTKAGVWGYHNLNETEGVVGIVNVR